MHLRHPAVYDQTISHLNSHRFAPTGAALSHRTHGARRDGCKRNLHASRNTYAAGATLETPLDEPRGAKPRSKREIPTSTEYDAPDLPVPSHRKDPGPGPGPGVGVRVSVSGA